MTMALQLAKEGHRLNSNVTEARTHREELIALLRKPPLATRPTWIIQAKDLHNQTKKYAPANWPRECAVSEILKDAKELTRRYQHWIPAHVSQPLPVTQLGHRVDRLKNLAADLEVFRNRLQQVADTLDSVQTIEQTACRGLGIACQAVERLTTCMRRAKPSFATSIIIHQRKLEKLEDESHRLTSELERRHAGLVKDKARNVDGWTESCHKALQAVLKALQTESRKVETDLRKEVEELQKVASFDRERAMQEAKRLLDVERPPYLPPAGKADDSMAAQISLLANQLDEMLQDRESLHVALEDIRFQIRNRIHDLFETLKETRQEAFTKFDELIELKRVSETDWPPLICATGRAEGLLDSANRDEEQLRNSGGTVSNVLKLVRKLVQSYKNVINETKAKEKTNQKDRQGLQELVDRIDRWQGQLEAYRESHRQDAAAVKAVRGRLSQIDRAIAKAKRRYRRNALSYSQAKGVLQELWSLAHGEDLPVRGSDRVIRVREIEG
jgi:DNA-binding ferritin-like protein